MKDKDKTHEQLLKELAQLHQRIAQLEGCERQRKEVEESLKRSNQEKTIVLDSISELVVYQDTRMRILWVNRAAAESVGADPQQLVGRHCYEIWPQRDRPCVGCPVVKARKSGRPQEAAMTTPDGRIWLIRGYPVRDVKGKMIGAVEVTLEITERQRAEESLRTERDKAQQYLDVAEIILVALNKKGEITLINRKGNHILGYKEGELIGKNWFTTCVPSRLRKKIKNGFLKLMAGEVTLTEFYENPVLTKSGTERMMAWHNALLKDTQGNPIGTLSSGEDITDRKQAEVALQLERNLVNRMMETSPAAITMVDPQGKITFANSQAEKVLGLTKDSITQRSYNMPAWHITDYEGNPFPDDQLPFRQVMRTGNPVFNVAHAVERPDGRRVLLSVNGAPLRDESGKIEGVVCTIEDITDRKQAEEKIRESKQLLEKTFSSLRDALLIIDANTLKIIDCNPAASEIFGYERNEIVGQLVNILHVDDKKQKEFSNHLYTAIETQGFFSQFEFTMKRKDGTIFPTEHNVTPIEDEHGNRIIWVSIVRDIRERKRAEETLQENEATLRALINAPTDSILLLDPQGIILDLNTIAAERLGKSRDKLIGTLADASLPGDVAKKRRSIISQILKTGREIRFEDERDGIWFDTVAHPITDKDGAIGKIEIIARDVTERKQAEEKLRENEERYKTLFDETVVGICLGDAETGIIVDCNEAMAALVGRERTDLIGKSQKILHPSQDDKELFSPTFKQHLTDKEGEILETQVITKAGDIKVVEIKANLLDLQGKKILQALFYDITDRKQAEVALRESETRFRTLFEAIPDTVLVHDDKGTILHINEIGAQRLEWSAKDLIGRNLREIVTPENVASIADHVRETHKAGWSRFETTYVSRSGWRTMAEVYEHPIVFGKKKAILSVARDITERKKAEEALRESEEKYRDLVENINDIIYATDEQGIITYIAPTIASVSGYTLSEIVGRPFLDFVYEEDKPSMQDALQRDISGQAEPNEYRMKTKSGEVRWVRTSSQPFFEGDRLMGLRGVLTDITDRRQAEEALLHEKIFSDAVMDSSPGLFFVLDDKGYSMRWNKNVEKVSGYSAQEIAKMNILDFVPKEDKKRAAQTLQETLSKGHTSLEINVLSKSGKKIPFYLTGLRTRIGNITCVVGTGFDITERKQAEEKLWESEERYRAVFEQAADSIVLIDTETGTLVDFNRKAHENLGYSREEFEKLKITDFDIIESAGEVAQHIEKIVKGGTDIFETKQRTKTGEIRDIQISSKAISIRGRDFLHSIWRDVTEQKQAKEALQRSYDQLQETFISSIHALASTVEMKDQYTAGHQPRVTQLACAIAEEMGLAEEQIEGIRMAGLIHDIGKIVVPAEILNKPGPLTEVQYEMIKMHPQAGYDILKDIKFPWPVAQIVQQHHERMDGSGYPQGLTGEGILLEARIMAVANVVEAMTAHRPYRPAYEIEEALAEISHHRGTKYDPAAVDACMRLFTERGFVFDAVQY